MLFKGLARNGGADWVLPDRRKQVVKFDRRKVFIAGLDAQKYGGGVHETLAEKVEKSSHTVLRGLRSRAPVPTLSEGLFRSLRFVVGCRSRRWPEAATLGNSACDQIAGRQVLPRRGPWKGRRGRREISVGQ